MIDEAANAACPVKVLHLSSAHPWTDNRVHLREASSLVKAGFEVSLYAVDNDLEVPDTGVVVTKVQPSGRLRRLTLGAMSAVRFAVASEAIVVHIHDPELIWAVPILRMRGKKVVYDAHEDLPSQVLDKSYLPGPLRAPVGAFAGILLRVAGHSNRIVAATEVVAKRFEEAKTSVVRNYPRIDTSARWVDPMERPLSMVYVGGLSRARGTDIMVDALNSGLMPSDWDLQLAGWGETEFLRSLADKPGWARVHFHGVVAPPAARTLIDSSRVGVVVLEDTPAHRDSLPTKMFEYMASGVPVIASDFALWRRILEEHDCGILVNPTSPDEIAGAIAAYAEDSALLRRHSLNGYHAVRKSVNWDSESEHLVQMYKDMLRSTSTWAGE